MNAQRCMQHTVRRCATREQDYGEAALYIRSAAGTDASHVLGGGCCAPRTGVPGEWLWRQTYQGRTRHPPSSNRTRSTHPSVRYCGWVLLRAVPSADWKNNGRCPGCVVPSVRSHLIIWNARNASLEDLTPAVRDAGSDAPVGNIVQHDGRCALGRRHACGRGIIASPAALPCDFARREKDDRDRPRPAKGRMLDCLLSTLPMGHVLVSPSSPFYDHITSRH